jgi:hypothetical protein
MPVSTTVDTDGAGAGVETPEVLDSRYSWGRLAVTLSVGIIGNAPMWMIVVILPAVQAEYSVSRAEVTLPMTLAFLGYGCAAACWPAGQACAATLPRAPPPHRSDRLPLNWVLLTPQVRERRDRQGG